MKEPSTSKPRFWLITLATWLIIGCGANASSFSKPQVIIDAHSHLFNAYYLPLKQIMIEMKVPPVAAEGLEVIILFISRDSNLAQGNRTAADNWDAQGRWLEKLSRMRTDQVRSAVIDELFRKRLGPQGLQALVDQGKLTPNNVQAIKAFVRGPAMENAKAAALPLTAEELARALEKTQLLTDVNSDSIQSLASIKGDLNFLAIVTSSEEGILHGLRRTFPEVKLFVHHMMDLECTYNERPTFEFGLQVAKMLDLQNRNPGVILTFAAFDPFRRESAVTYARRAYDQGAVGFKFYPPDGYRPYSNAVPPMDMSGTVVDQYNRRYANCSGADLDRINAEFFSYCESNDIPIFVHCTPGGFEAVPGYGGIMADPAYWTPVLERHKRLRVCFGHSGGAALWFNETADTNSVRFAEEIIQICLKYDNAYCDAGYWDPIITEEGVEELQTILPALIGKYPGLAKKMVYGTDWFMISREENYKNYLNAMLKALLNPKGIPPSGWGQFVNDFFAGNEARFLKLDTLANDPRFNPKMRSALSNLVEELPTHWNGR